MAFELPQLPYAEDALAPHISAETISYHYGKHHKKYVDTLNELTQGTDLADKSLEDIITSTEGKVFNQAAQVWNHTFYWRGMGPDGGGAPTGEAADAIGSAFGSYDAFVEQFAAEAGGHFGSGWAWLVDDGSGLAITSTHDADNPLTHSQKPLLTCDVWEHAYYIDYRNARPDYVATFLNSLVNWDWVNQQLSG
ncbi:MAG: Superoxide dismutase [Fe] [Acidimicrobiales bacterium]|nr:MAG: superoxide dismutase [Actinomycetota bacterium]MBV6507371.1 Superoxide dismutase [Fe] [Acidimicrobiales bacterium]RIK04498.1 MAG: superoxide dismutase [Fe] [Acidobacteriota bacterium]